MLSWSGFWGRVPTLKPPKELLVYFFTRPPPSRVAWHIGTPVWKRLLSGVGEPEEGYKTCSFFHTVRNLSCCESQLVFRKSISLPCLRRRVFCLFVTVRIKNLRIRVFCCWLIGFVAVAVLRWQFVSVQSDCCHA